MSYLLNFRLSTFGTLDGRVHVEVKSSIYLSEDIIDAVRLYLAGKASCWHAEVLLAAPTVKMLMTMDNAIAVAFSCLFQHKQAQRFAPLDRACKY